MPFFHSGLALVQLSTPIASPPVRALGLEGEIEASEEGRVPIQTLFRRLFTSQESGEVNKQVLVFNCGPFIALPSSVLECSTPPFFPSICPSPSLTSLLYVSARLLSWRPAINSPSSVFFSSCPSPEPSPRLFLIFFYFEPRWSCFNHLMMCHYAAIDLRARVWEWTVFTASILDLNPYRTNRISGGRRCPALTWWMWCRFHYVHIVLFISVI